MLVTESYLLKPSQLTGKMNNHGGSEVEPEANRSQPYPFTSTIFFDMNRGPRGNKLLANQIYLRISSGEGDVGRLCSSVVRAVVGNRKTWARIPAQSKASFFPQKDFQIL